MMRRRVAYKDEASIGKAGNAKLDALYTFSTSYNKRCGGVTCPNCLLKRHKYGPCTKAMGNKFGRNIA